MDFSALKKKIKDVTTPLIEKSAPLLDKAKDAGYKAIDFTQKQLQNTPLILKSHDEYIELMTKKRAILISYDEKDPANRDILLRSPIWAAKAYGDIAEFRLAEVTKASELMTEIGINTPIDMQVWYIGERTFHSTDRGEIMKWWETRCYDGKADENSQITNDTVEGNDDNRTFSEGEVPDTRTSIVDPLSGK